MNIPGSICLPNGELTYRATGLLPDETTPVVVHCAGRTRSIIGAQILRESGLPNPIFALENGTQGWTLAGLTLEHGSTRNAEQSKPAQSPAVLLAEARRRAAEWTVPLIAAETCSAWLHDNARTTYFLDVRTSAEFAAGHAQGARHAPGGQLLQSTDTWLAVRRARVVLVDDSCLRAVTIARWLRLMGWDAYVLDGGSEAWNRVSAPSRATAACVDVPERTIPAPNDTPIIIDIRSSMSYRAGHIDAARWTLRPRLAETIRDFPKTARLGICSEDDDALGLVLKDLIQAGFSRLEYYGADTREWADAGYRIVTTADSPSDEDAIDFVFFTHDRHIGNLEAARRYLAWETGLVSRLNQFERSSFRI
jgi:rhodanese-related sulfurtransferase